MKPLLDVLWERTLTTVAVEPDGVCSNVVTLFGSSDRCRVPVTRPLL